MLASLMQARRSRQRAARWAGFKGNCQKIAARNALRIQGSLVLALLLTSGGLAYELTHPRKTEFDANPPSARQVFLPKVSETDLQEDAAPQLKLSTTLQPN